MSWIGVAVGGGTTAANMFGQAQREKAQKKIAAETARWSPWTGMKPEEIQYANPAGALGSGVATAFGVHQGLANAKGAAPGVSSSPSMAAPETPLSPGFSFGQQQNAALGGKFGLGLNGPLSPEEQWAQMYSPMAGTTPGS